MRLLLVPHHLGVNMCTSDVHAHRDTKLLTKHVHITRLEKVDVASPQTPTRSPSFGSTTPVAPKGVHEGHYAALWTPFCSPLLPQTRAAISSKHLDTTGMYQQIFTSVQESSASCERPQQI